jgi:hypothetical protein
MLIISISRAKNLQCHRLFLYNNFRHEAETCFRCSYSLKGKGVHGGKPQVVPHDTKHPPLAKAGVDHATRSYCDETICASYDESSCASSSQSCA